jgi:hypothetical protein
MAHFAKLDENNKVTQVVVVNNNVIMVEGQESEIAGIQFLAEITGHTNWRQTSYNGNFRGKYAAIGQTYDEAKDAFRWEKPYRTWIWDENIKDWTAPISKPQDGKLYAWFDGNENWVEVVTE